MFVMVTALSSFQMQLKSSLRKSKFWLFFATTNLAIWHAVLTSRIDSGDLITTIIFWLAALYLLWQKRTEIVIDSKAGKNFIGMFLLGIVLYRGMFLFWHESFVLQFLPFFGFLGLALVASGWKYIKQYTRILLIFFIVVVFDWFTFSFLNSFLKRIHFSEITAQFSAFFLHYIGFDVTQQGISIFLPTGSVKVLYFCTGGPLIGLLLSLTFVFFLVTPLTWKLRFNLLWGLFGIGFFLGVIRVALLAVVVSDKSAFEYWHGNEGNQIFSLIAFTTWGLLVHFISESYDKQQNLKLQENQNQPNHQETFQPESPSIARSEQVKGSHFWLFPGLGITVAAIALYTVLFPQVGRRQMPSINFPNQLTLSKWKTANSVPLLYKETEENDPENNSNFNQITSGKQYKYRQQGTEVTVELRLIEGTLGSVKNFVKNYTSLEEEVAEEAFQKGKTRSQPELGRYRLFTDKTHAYLSTCLSPQGESTVSQNNFIRKMNRNIVDEHLLSKILGQRSFRERRCLWVHLSTPLAEQSPEKSYRVLESVFQQGYSKWQGLF